MKWILLVAAFALAACVAGAIAVVVGFRAQIRQYIELQAKDEAEKGRAPKTALR